MHEFYAVQLHMPDTPHRAAFYCVLRLKIEHYVTVKTIDVRLPKAILLPEQYT